MNNMTKDLQNLTLLARVMAFDNDNPRGGGRIEGWIVINGIDEGNDDEGLGFIPKREGEY